MWETGQFINVFCCFWGTETPLVHCACVRRLNASSGKNIANPCNLLKITSTQYFSRMRKQCIPRHFPSPAWPGYEARPVAVPYSIPPSKQGKVTPITHSMSPFRRCIQNLFQYYIHFFLKGLHTHILQKTCVKQAILWTQHIGVCHWRMFMLTWMLHTTIAAEDTKDQECVVFEKCTSCLPSQTVHHQRCIRGNIARNTLQLVLCWSNFSIKP